MNGMIVFYSRKTLNDDLVLMHHKRKHMMLVCPISDTEIEHLVLYLSDLAIVKLLLLLS